MGFYRMKDSGDLVIQAIQFTGENVDEILDAFGSGHIAVPDERDYITFLDINDDPQVCYVGSWIAPVRKQGRFKLYKQEIFADWYEEIELQGEPTLPTPAEPYQKEGPAVKRYYQNNPTGLVAAAIQFTGRNLEEIYTEFGTAGFESLMTGDGTPRLVVRTRNGTSTANVGDWIIEEPNQDDVFDVCMQGLFAESYTPVPRIPAFVDEAPTFALKKATNVINLTVMVGNEDDLKIVTEKLHQLALGFGSVFPMVSVATGSIDEDGNQVDEDMVYETFCEDTMTKVAKALMETGLSAGQVTDAISLMQNEGILFRERP